VTAPKAGAKVVVVMPARNAARTLEATVSAIPTGLVDEIILVDDKSTDDTLEVARRLPVHLIWHPHNVGYGGNQKTCYLEALQRNADVVVMLHPDGQYEPALIPRMVQPILDGDADMVLGSRLAIPGAWKTSGMPRYKYLANRGLTMIENVLLGTHFSELHTGYRAYSRRLLLTVPFLRNSIDFVFDSELVMQAVHFGFRIVEVPARTRYFAEASSASPKQSVVYGIKTLGAAARLAAALAQVHAVRDHAAGSGPGRQARSAIATTSSARSSASGRSVKSSGVISAAPGRGVTRSRVRRQSYSHWRKRRGARRRSLRGSRASSRCNSARSAASSASYPADPWMPASSTAAKNGAQSAPSCRASYST
jgi:glycosyltransferase involved in cell wall biosynthesis